MTQTRRATEGAREIPFGIIRAPQGIGRESQSRPIFQHRTAVGGAMRNFTADGTSSRHEEPGTWAITLPGLSADGVPVQLKAGLPSYHPVIHFVGYAGIARTVLAAFGPLDLAASAAIYAGCFVLALITGKLVQRSTSDRVPRICSAFLGMTGFIAGTLAGQLAIQHQVTHNMTDVAVPLSAIGFMVVVTLIGEMLGRWAPGPRSDSEPAPHRHPVTRKSSSKAQPASGN